jgi:hypothetical protein
MTAKSDEMVDDDVASTEIQNHSVQVTRAHNSAWYLLLSLHINGVPLITVPDIGTIEDISCLFLRRKRPFPNLFPRPPQMLIFLHNQCEVSRSRRTSIDVIQNETGDSQRRGGNGKGKAKTLLRRTSGRMYERQ